MKFFIQRTALLLVMIFFTLTSQANSQVYHYQAKVKGMVCAFCAYSVAKNLRRIQGIIPESVRVSLEQNRAEFSSSRKITKLEIDKVFTQSGFSLSQLKIVSSKNTRHAHKRDILLDLSVNVFNTEEFESVFRSLGNIAINTGASLLIEAPQEQEEMILKALLMGRKKSVNVEFNPVDIENTVHIQLYQLVE